MVSVDLPFANEHFVAVDKPADWLSVPSRLGEREQRPCLGTTLEAELGVRLWPVHRLDAEVTGLILFAKNAAAHRQASGWFEQRTVDKSYEAWTEGAPPAATGEALWRSCLLRGKKRAYESPHGKPAETLARCLGQVPGADGQAALRWELKPLTGRAHQLRFELARHGHPILGDALYGATRPFRHGAGHGIALRCVRLDFARCQGAAALGLPAELTVPPLATRFPEETPPA